MEISKRVNILFIGNPGVGKSTLLNALIGNAQFRAGISLDGGGVTQYLQEAFFNDIHYMDTPGLNDIDRRKECANEITKALKKTGLYYICFVLTTEAGRIRPDDKTLVRLVLDAAKEICGQFSIIVNKLPPSLYDHYTKNPTVFPTIFFRDFTSISNSIYYIKHNPSLDDTNDTIFDINSLEGFNQWLKKCPCIDIHPENVNSIESESWETLLKGYQNTIDKLQETLEKNREEFQKILENERERQDRARIESERKQIEVEQRHRQEIERLNIQMNEFSRRPFPTPPNNCVLL